MKKARILRVVRRGIKSHALLSIRRKKIDSCCLSFLPMKISDKLILGLNDQDFQLNGYKIFRVKDITGIDDKCNFYESMFRQEGLLKELAEPEEINIGSWKTALADLQIQGKIIIVEKESNKRRDSDFAIGSVTKVCKKKIKFRHFDAEGVWQKKLLHIPFRGITCVSFGGRYEEVFAKYV